MHTTILRKVGGSVMLAVPPALLKLLDLEVGGKVEVAVEGTRLVVEKGGRPHYSLDELLTQCQSKKRRDAAEQGWVTGEAAGRELL